jgi:wingless-type MMTV integration site family protein 5
MCTLKPDVIPSVSQGATIAIKECKQQFHHERWNCSTSNDATVFGRLLEIGEFVKILAFSAAPKLSF